VGIPGEVKIEYTEILHEADMFFIEELYKADGYHNTSQAFAVFLPVKSVGVVGDARRYEWVIALRAVEIIDFMTVQWAHLPCELPSSRGEPGSSKAAPYPRYYLA
jgi:GMP synthase (glutamine-hydrolysing)